jgi:hypothetical protein
MSNQVSRRAFLATTGSGAAALSSAAQAPPKEKQTIGIQIGSISFLDEGTDKVLDILQEKACVNTESPAGS